MTTKKTAREYMQELGIVVHPDETEASLVEALIKSHDFLRRQYQKSLEVPPPKRWFQERPYISWR